MKFLVLGANGMAGHMISNYLKSKGHLVYGYARRPSPIIDCIIGDVRNLELLESTIQKGNFDIIVNCVGILNQFAEAQKDIAVFVNSYLPHYLVALTEKTRTKVIHISTDCVFSGKTGNYEENSFRDGTSFYDRSKALGEIEDNKNITLRNSIIGPDMNRDGIGLLNWFMKQNGTIKGYQNAIWNGITTLQLAKIIEDISDKNITGLFNMVPEESISKLELLNLFNMHFRNGDVKIIPDLSIKIDKSLKRTNYAYPKHIPSYEVMIRELADWTKQYQHIYPDFYFQN